MSMISHVCDINMRHEFLWMTISVQVADFFKSLITDFFSSTYSKYMIFYFVCIFCAENMQEVKEKEEEEKQEDEVEMVMKEKEEEKEVEEEKLEELKVDDQKEEEQEVEDQQCTHLMDKMQLGPRKKQRKEVELEGILSSDKLRPLKTPTNLQQFCFIRDDIVSGLHNIRKKKIEEHKKVKY